MREEEDEEGWNLSGTWCGDERGMRGTSEEEEEELEEEGGAREEEEEGGWTCEGEGGWTREEGA